MYKRVLFFCEHNKKRLALLSIALFIFMFGIAITNYTHTYNSDDAVVQDIVENWSISNRRFYVGPQSFVFKIPLYLLVSSLMNQTRSTLFVIALIQNLILIVLFLATAVHIFRNLTSKAPLSLLSIVWLTSLGTFFYGFLLNPNTRNMEIGVAFGLYAMALSYLKNSIKLKDFKYKFLLVVLFSLTAYLIISDAYFIYFFMMPLILTLAIDSLLFKYDFRKVRLIAFLILSLATRPFAGKILLKLGFIFNSSVGTAFTEIDKFPANLKISTLGLLKLHNADFFGLNPTSLECMVAVVNLTLLILVYGFMAKNIKRFIVNRDTTPVFLSLGIILNFVIYTLSTTPTEIANSRYMILIPFYTGLSMMYLARSVVSNKRWRRLLWGLISLAALGNIILTVTKPENKNDYYSDLNNNNKQIITILNKENVSVGYAGYWNAGINNYLSNNKITFIPITCEGATVRPFYWYTMKSTYQKRDKRIFVINALRDTASCVNVDTYAQFGSLESKIPLSKEYELLIFNTTNQPKLPWDANKNKSSKEKT